MKETRHSIHMGAAYGPCTHHLTANACGGCVYAGGGGSSGWKQQQPQNGLFSAQNSCPTREKPKRRSVGG